MRFLYNSVDWWWENGSVRCFYTLRDFACAEQLPVIQSAIVEIQLLTTADAVSIKKPQGHYRLTNLSDRTTCTPGCCNGSDKCSISILLSYFCKNLYNRATFQPHGVFIRHATEHKEMANHASTAWLDIFTHFSCTEQLIRICDLFWDEVQCLTALMVRLCVVDLRMRR